MIDFIWEITGKGAKLVCTSRDSTLSKHQPIFQQTGTTFLFVVQVRLHNRLRQPIEKLTILLNKLSCSPSLRIASRTTLYFSARSRWVPPADVDIWVNWVLMWEAITAVRFLLKDIFKTCVETFNTKVLD